MPLAAPNVKGLPPPFCSWILFECEVSFLLLFFLVFISFLFLVPADNNVLYYGFQTKTVVGVPEGADSMNHALYVCVSV